jgi:protein-S-isoprenylcysteine O-methyltransferase Ste14
MSTKGYVEVAIKPPILFAAALALGYALTCFWPIGPGLARPNDLGLAVALAFVVAGFALAILSIRRFRMANTSVLPGEPASALVTAEPNKISRNPIYIGFVLVYFGVVLHEES